MLFIIAIALAVAGIVTENGAFYALAGAVAAVQVLLFVVAMAGFKAVKKSIDRDFSNFDGRFDAMGIRNRRPTRRF